MGLFDRLFGRTLVPSVSRRVFSGVSRRMTAGEAWAALEPALLGLDPGAQLTLITSGLDLDQNGTSRVWEFVAVLPGIKARAVLSVAPQEDAEDPDRGPFELTQRLSVIPAEEVRRARAIPHRFRDSPKAVADFVSAGVDFVAGPPDMKMETQIDASHRVEWVTFCWDRRYATGFADE